MSRIVPSGVCIDAIIGPGETSPGHIIGRGFDGGQPMRYLSSISLALIVLMALACTAATATPSGPMYSEEEAIAVLKEHLQAKPVPIPNAPFKCFSYIWGEFVTWSAKYDNEAHRWDVSIGAQSVKSLLVGGIQPPTPPPRWSVYERTKSIVATGDGWC